MSFMPRRRLYLRFQLDTNRINSRQRLPNMTLLETWAEEGLIELFMSEAAQDEARAGGDSLRSRKALGYIFSETIATTAEEQARMRAIEAILFSGGARTAGEHKDVEIAFNAGKYRAILVTADGGSKSQSGGILGNRQALADIGIRVMTDGEAVALVMAKIGERDDMARMVASHDGEPLPDWVGKDGLPPVSNREDW